MQMGMCMKANGKTDRDRAEASILMVHRILIMVGVLTKDIGKPT